MDNAELKQHLYECLRCEVMMSSKPFSWWRTLHKAFKCPERRYFFWWRIASYLYKTKKNKKIARKINRSLVLKYGTEIQLPAHIGPGLIISHHQGIVINSAAKIGKSFRIRQNVTIGISGNSKSGLPPSITIGDNVEIGAGSYIISENIKIGNNVTIGAMSFINKNIPDNCTVFTEKINRTIVKNN